MMVLDSVEHAIWQFCNADARIIICNLVGDGPASEIMCPSIGQAMEYAKEAGLLDGSVF